MVAENALTSKKYAKKKKRGKAKINKGASTSKKMALGPRQALHVDELKQLKDKCFHFGEKGH